MTKKRAVVLFNLGGPDSPEAVQPFLFNLFNDPAIISVPWPFRWLLAKLISRRRAPIARDIYAHLGGKSPLLELTEDQAVALETALNGQAGENSLVHKVFVCMRYWHPMSDAAVRAVKDFDPDDVILLPLYPQYSTTTTGSSIEDWRRAAAKARLTKPTQAVCCYPTADRLVDAQAGLIADGLAKVSRDIGRPRLLFSAHGLPKKVIAGGDPYQWQVEQTAAAVIGKLTERGINTFDPVICYQSRVGPLEWIGPATEDELRRAGDDKAPVIIVPIAFVSEHSETLVELDIEYRELAETAGVPSYIRVPALGTHPGFIETLAGIVQTCGSDTTSGEGPASHPVCGHPSGARVCPLDRAQCPHQP